MSTTVPDALGEPGRAAFERFAEHLGAVRAEALGRRLEANSHAAELDRALTLSPYLADQLVRRSERFAQFLEAPGFTTPLRRSDLDALVTAELGPVDVAGRAEDLAALRHVRNMAMMRMVWREVTGRADLAETTAGATLLAERLIDTALTRLHGRLVARDGEPLAGDGRPQRLSVLALGKLGAGELNLSSDVDLVLAYAEAGRTAGSGRTNQQFFLRLAQQLVRALDEVTAEGFVFRVDLRLRPYGDSGPLVMSFDAIEQYYEEQGRDWERYAWIKARPVAGDLAAGNDLVTRLTPFVYRRYLDFGAIQSLRDMKDRINEERESGTIRDDVKLGPGGIREVEFIAQVFQLIWGGREPALRERRLVPVLETLADLGLLARPTVDALREAYVFLRDTEHKLQARRDEQTQQLPRTDEARQHLALAMGFDDYAAFAAALGRHRGHVADAFEAVIREDEDERESPAGARIWRRLRLDDLAAAGFRDPAGVADALGKLKQEQERPSVGADGRKRLEALMPKLIMAAAASEDPDLALKRSLPLLTSVMRRSAYLALLLENPAALTHLMELGAASRHLADNLARHPILLDELLDARSLFRLPDAEAAGGSGVSGELALELAGDLGQVRGDFEQELEVLRNFKESHELRIAASEIRGTLPLMKVSDYLTWLAEAILGQALALAWRETAPRFPDYEDRDASPFLIVGYGKLGGLELGPGSDLDLVFVHDLPGAAGPFLSRMVKRLLHILTTRTHLGALYEVDMRLRPSGRSGTTVTSLSAFRQYQLTDAWEFEHQALVRARPVAGHAELGERFADVRREVLVQPRPADTLADGIAAMRRRITATASGPNDLKRRGGGIVDIEFVVQYLVLAYANRHPALCDFTDNIRILETASRLELLDPEDARRLIEAYLALRSEGHRAALDEPDEARAARVVARHRRDVSRVWQRLFGDRGT